MIYEEYANYTKEYKQKYGEQCVVLMEIGSFFELYGIQNDHETSGADMSIAQDILNITVSRKNKNILENSVSNPLMAGFPNYQLKKFVDILVKHRFTIVLVEQTTPAPNPKREVTQIISPSTYVDNITSFKSQTLMVIYIESFNTFKKDMIGMGCCIVDLSTKKTTCFEITKNSYTIEEEITRLCLTYNPKELIMTSKPKSKIDYISFPANVYTHDYMDQLDEKFVNKDIQSMIIKRVFDARLGFLSPFEYLNIERSELICVAYSYMLDFVYLHDEKLLNKLEIPEIISFDDLLYISNDTLSQLNIINHENNKTDNKTLGSILNTCTTFIGKRYFIKRLINPLTSTENLNESYNKIQSYIDKKYHESTKPVLKKINDIERIIKKHTISPVHLYNLYSSLQHVQSLLKIVSLSPSCDMIIEFMESNIDFSKHVHFTTNIEKNIFHTGIHNDLDELCIELKTITDVFNNHEFVIKHSNIIKFEFTEKEGYVFTSTQKRFSDNKDIFKNYNCIKIKQNTCKIYDSITEDYNIRYFEINDKIKLLMKSYYNKFIEELLYTFENKLDTVIANIEDIDFNTACAINAIAFGQCKPIIEDSFNGDSYIQANQLRHPIIEHIQKDLKYVPNDILLDQKNNGLILYGINASGKSSLMKSIGISIIMAQSGMFVAADNFKFYPFLNIFSRISNQDNMYKKQSTFTVEMSELRNILNSASNRSLIIGDELCSGTESISAISLVSAGIIQLTKLNAKFIFATHLHELSNIDEIKQLETVSIKHLSITYCHETNTIFYDRIIKDGSGDTLYGLEVCKSLDLGQEFITIANNIRWKILKIQNTIVNKKKNKYNNKVIKDVCTLCKCTADDIHHIKQQKLANENDMIGTFHKNAQFNLVALCKKCHIMVHDGKIQIDDYCQTDKGILLKHQKE